MIRKCIKDAKSTVAPLVGAWIEITEALPEESAAEEVAPLVGAWIEIYNHFELIDEKASLPSWERGLKSEC